jgi:sugar lactone lactonase YvrE
MLAGAGSCGPPEPVPQYEWQALRTELPGALLSVWGFGERDVYAVGADSRDGMGPVVLHYDGVKFTRLDTGLIEGDLWWVYGVAPDTVFMAGSGGVVLRYNPQARTFARMTTPGDATIYGIWGASPTDVWAVGGNVAGSGGTGAAGVVWHFDGNTWQNVALPGDTAARFTIFKVWGSAANDVWAVGDNSTTLHYDGTAWSVVPVPEELRGKLLTVHGRGTERFAVGGTANGILLQSEGTGWRRVMVEGLPRLTGVYAPANGGPIAVGANGTVVHRNRQGQWNVITRAPNTPLDFHSVWVDPGGNVWAVGGNIASTPLVQGMLWRFGTHVADAPLEIEPSLQRCPETPGTICTWAGTGEPGFNGDRRPLRESTLYWPVDMEFSPGDQGYVLDWNNHRVRRVRDDGTFETVVGTEIPGDGDMGMTDLMAPGAPGTDVALNHPTDLLFDRDGTLLVCAWHNHKIRRWNPMTGRVTVIAGRGPGFTGDGGPAAMALLKQPSKFVLDAMGNLYFFDQGNVRVRRIAADGMMSTVAGNGMYGFAGDGGSPLMAMFSVQGGENPEPGGGLALDAMGRLYVADTGNNRIRLIDLERSIITTVVGTGVAGHGGDGGPAAMAQINSPRDIEIGPDGNLYIADTGNQCIRMVDLRTNVISTVAGRCGTAGYAGDRGPATRALLDRPFGIAFDRAGNLYISDTYSNRIRRVQR